MATTGRKYAYTTLITRSSYLAGVTILADTLKKHGSQYPLIVFYTPSLDASAVRALQLEAPKTNLILQPCELLLPTVKTYYIAERFIDTWTKLRVFEIFDYDALCYLDADMSIYKNMDAIFAHAETLPSDWIAANHACVCNLDHDPWAPEDWTVENCAYTPLSHPDALTHPAQPTPDARPTYHLLNSGMFLYHPSRELWDQMLTFFNHSDKLSTYKFPDQDFLADFFHRRWRGLGWQFNALKTMRYIHPNIWRDGEVICLHYIVDKPWASRVGADGVAGFKGKDGVTHGWWWEQFRDWEAERKAEGSAEVLELVKAKMAPEDGTQHDDPDMQAIGGRVQAFANNKASEEGEKEQQPEVGKSGEEVVSDRQPFRPKALGERGHGPMVRPSGSSQMRP